MPGELTIWTFRMSTVDKRVGVRRADVEGHVELAALELGKRGLGRDLLVEERVELRAAAVVVGVGLEADELVGHDLLAA